MKSGMLAFAITILSASPTFARCPTLNGYLEFKACELRADTFANKSKLSAKFETMRQEDLAKLRTRQASRQDAPTDIRNPTTRLAPDQRELTKNDPLSFERRNIEAQIGQTQWQRQMNSFEQGRARNEMSVERGRARSQNLLYGQSK